MISAQKWHNNELLMAVWGYFKSSHFIYLFFYLRSCGRFGWLNLWSWRIRARRPSLWGCSRITLLLLNYHFCSKEITSIIWWRFDLILPLDLSLLQNSFLRKKIFLHFFTFGSSISKLCLSLLIFKKRFFFWMVLEADCVI